MRLTLALGMLIPVFYACNNDDDNGTPAGPTITAPDDASVATGASLNLTFAVTVPGGYASATPSVEPTSAGTVDVTQQPADGATSGNVVVSFTGAAEGEATVTLALVDQLNQPAEATVKVTVTSEGTTPPTEPVTYLSPGDTIAKLGELDQFLQALTAAELVAALNQGDKITIFAPNNTAFADLLADQGTADIPALLAQLSKAGLSNVLQAHVIADSLPADLLQTQAYPTLNPNATLNVVKTGDNVTVNGAAVVTPNIFTSNGVIHIIDAVINRPPPPVAEGVFTVVDTIANRDDLSSLEAALQAVNIIETLRTEGPFTVFAPNNAAFDALIAAQGATDLNGLVTSLGADAVAAILQAHVVEDTTLAAVNLRDKDVYNTISGATLTVTTNDIGEIRINGSRVLETNLIAGNGIVHVIDSVVNRSASNDGSGGFTVTIENVSSDKRFFQHGVFNTPQGATAAGPASADGGVYQFQFYAGPNIIAGDGGPRLSFMTKLGASNDLFLATGQNGIEIYPNGTALTGDITAQMLIWDAGTEDNATGADEQGTVLPYGGQDFTTAQFSVTISNVGALFTVQITNNSGATANTTSTPLSPGVYGIHTLDNPLFQEGVRVGLDGLETLAEEGDPTTLSATMDRLDGFVVPLSRGIFAVHSPEIRPVLVTGEIDRGVGLEALAEDGDPTAIAAVLAQNAAIDTSGVFGPPAGEPGLILPGQQYSFTVNAEPGDHLSIVTMMVQSNDIIYSTPENGIPLFRTNGRPFNGNASRQMVSYDIGTELNEYPGAGLNQPIRQAAPNTGPADTDGTVRRVTMDDVTPAADGFIYRPEGERIRIIITPN